MAIKKETSDLIKEMIRSGDSQMALVGEFLQNEAIEGENEEFLIACTEEIKDACNMVIRRLKGSPEETLNPFRCMVACDNASGDPDLFFVIVECTEQEMAEGCHYEAAKRHARDEGYEGHMVAFDEADAAGRQLEGLFAWESASTIDIKPEDRE